MTTRTQTLRNTLFSSVGMYTEYVLGMLTSIVIARHLGPDGFGAYSLVIWLVAMGVATTNSGTASAAIKFVAELRGGGREASIPALIAYLRRAQWVFLLVVLLAGAAVFVFAGEHVAPGMNHVLLLGFLVVATTLRAAYMFNIGVAKGFENFRATAIVALVSTPVNLGLVVAAIWFDAPVEWLLAVFVVSSVVFYGMSRRQITPLVPAAHSPAIALPPDLLARVRRHMWLTAMIVSVGFVAASEVEVLFLTLYGSAHAAGQFKVAYQIAIGSAALVPGVFGALLLPMMANAMSQGRDVAGRRFVATTSYLALLAAPLVAFGAVFSGAVIQALYGSAYTAAGPVFAVCLLGVSIMTMTNGGSSLLISADRQRSVLLVVVTCGALKVALDALLIRYYGLTGAAMAYLAVSVTCAVATMALAIRVSGAVPDWSRLLRISMAATLAALIALPLRGQLAPLAAAALGAMVLALTYAPLTLLLGCWSRGDIEYLQRLHQHLMAGRPRASARFLAWAYERAPEGRAS
ncbi:MAG: polysaccharide biosynthesis C-terminal domain-containing protein [Lysobacter sp.]|nr:polysaccharide biosynthesis C-terminal domain-containing protein [Lysobacter sp.]